MPHPKLQDSDKIATSPAIHFHTEKIKKLAKNDHVKV